jgi:putative transposase
VSDTFRAFQPVTIPDSQLDSLLAMEEAALDVGASNLVACSTTTGNQYLYDGRELFGRFHETTDEIARLQSKLREERYSSKRIRRLYRQRTKRRDHAQNAPVRDLVERLYDEGVATVYVGDLTDVLDTRWSVRANEKTTTSGRSRSSSNASRASVKSMASLLKTSRKHGRVRRVPNVVTTRRRFATEIR